MKSNIKFALAAGCTVAAGVALSVVLTRAQTPAGFGGFLAVYQDYLCNPDTSGCTPSTLNIRKVLPTGEEFKETQTPHGLNPDQAQIVTNKSTSFLYLSIGMYYTLPARKVQAFTSSSDSQCQGAAALRKATYLGPVNSHGFRAFQYDVAQFDGTHNQLSFFPDAGCEPLESVVDFGESKTYQRLSRLVPGFNDATVLTPPAVLVKADPQTIIHKLYVTRWTSPDSSSPMSQADAEAKWTTEMANQNGRIYKETQTAQARWEKYHL